MIDRKRTDELTVITKTYDLILWSCNHTGKFPRNHRFVLGERIERILGTVLGSSRAEMQHWEVDLEKKAAILTKTVFQLPQKLRL